MSQEIQKKNRSCDLHQLLCQTPINRQSAVRRKNQYHYNGENDIGGGITAPGLQSMLFGHRSEGQAFETSPVFGGARQSPQFPLFAQ